MKPRKRDFDGNKLFDDELVLLRSGELDLQLYDIFFDVSKRFYFQDPE